MGSLRRDRNPLISDDLATNTLFWLLLGQIGSAIFGSICQLRPSNLCSAIGSTVRSAVDSVFSRKPPPLIPRPTNIVKKIAFSRAQFSTPASGRCTSGCAPRFPSRRSPTSPRCGPTAPSSASSSRTHSRPTRTRPATPTSTGPTVT